MAKWLQTRIPKESLEDAKVLEKQGFDSPHPNSIMGQALATGDHETVTLILDRARADEEDLRAMNRWAKKGFTEFGYDD